MKGSLLERNPGTGEFDPFFVPHDRARLDYGRLLWKKQHTRRRLLDHWTDPRHPGSKRFIETWRPFVERLLSSDPEEDESLDREFREQGLSLRTVMREVPPVFGSFY